MAIVEKGKDRREDSAEGVGARSSSTADAACASGPAESEARVGCNSHDEALRRQFQEFVSQWKADTMFLSSINDMVTHPAYLRIIGMGKDSLPLLLAELRREPDHWFVALQAITGVNPIPGSLRGDVAQMTHAWLTWAEQQGL